MLHRPRTVKYIEFSVYGKRERYNFLFFFKAKIGNEIKNEWNELFCNRNGTHFNVFDGEIGDKNKNEKNFAMVSFEFYLENRTLRFSWNWKGNSNSRKFKKKRCDKVRFRPRCKTKLLHIKISTRFIAPIIPIYFNWSNT